MKKLLPMAVIALTLLRGCDLQPAFAESGPEQRWIRGDAFPVDYTLVGYYGQYIGRYHRVPLDKHALPQPRPFVAECSQQAPVEMDTEAESRAYVLACSR